MSYILLEYLCPACGHRTESLEKRKRQPKTKACEACGETAARTVSAVHGKKFVISAATRGKPDAPPAPTATNTEAIGEGQDVDAWRAERKAVWRDYDRKRRRAKGAPI